MPLLIVLIKYPSMYIYFCLLFSFLYADLKNHTNNNNVDRLSAFGDAIERAFKQSHTDTHTVTHTHAAFITNSE